MIELNMDRVIDRVGGFYHDVSKRFNPQKWYRRNPIDILKRLQREAFSDLMNIRDRQEKVERMLSFYKLTKGGPFKDSTTNLEGEVEIGGALLFVDNVDQQVFTRLTKAGLKTGIHSKFSFQTNITEKDAFVAEFISAQSDNGNVVDSPLSLSKVMYSAKFSDWFSAVVIPWGARCKDVTISSNQMHQERNLTEFSSTGPLIFRQHHDAAVAFTVTRSNVAASLSEFVSIICRNPDSVDISRCFSTFGQIIYEVSNGTKLSLLGHHRKIITQSQEIVLSSFTMPIGILRARRNPDAAVNPDRSVDTDPQTSAALMLEYELDDSARISGWIEMQNSTPRCLQWGVTFSDTPEDQLGWGLSMSGTAQGSSSWDHLQAEAFLKFNIGGRCSLQPGIVYVKDVSAGIPALMLKSSWAL